MIAKLLNILKISIKLCILVIGICVGGMDMVLTYPINRYLYVLYVFVIVICLVSFIGTFFKKIRKVSWLVFGASFSLYVGFNFLPEVAQKFSVDACLDSGKGVWDYKEHRCRTDCWHWSREKGCEKE